MERAYFDRRVHRFDGLLSSFLSICDIRELYVLLESAKSRQASGSKKTSEWLSFDKNEVVLCVAVFATVE